MNNHNYQATATTILHIERRGVACKPSCRSVLTNMPKLYLGQHQQGRKKQLLYYSSISGQAALQHNRMYNEYLDCLLRGFSRFTLCRGFQNFPVKIQSETKRMVCTNDKIIGSCTDTWLKTIAIPINNWPWVPGLHLQHRHSKGCPNKYEYIQETKQKINKHNNKKKVCVVIFQL